MEATSIEYSVAKFGSEGKEEVGMDAPGEKAVSCKGF